MNKVSVGCGTRGVLTIIAFGSELEGEGDADKKLDRGGPGLGGRMYSREDVELALEGLAEGMSVREVSEMVGCRGSTVRDWAAGRLPRSCTGAPPRGSVDVH